MCLGLTVHVGPCRRGSWTHKHWWRKQSKGMPTRSLSHCIPEDPGCSEVDIGTVLSQALLEDGCALLSLEGQDAAHTSLSRQLYSGGAAASAATWCHSPRQGPGSRALQVLKVEQGEELKLRAGCGFVQMSLCCGLKGQWLGCVKDVCQTFCGVKTLLQALPQGKD